MAGKTSALCCRGAENVLCANNAGPRATATDPTRLDVSTARISGSSMITCPNLTLNVGGLCVSYLKYQILSAKQAAVQFFSCKKFAILINYRHDWGLRP